MVHLHRVKRHKVKQLRVKRHWVKNATKGKSTKGQIEKKYFMYYFRVKIVQKTFGPSAAARTG